MAKLLCNWITACEIFFYMYLYPDSSSFSIVVQDFFFLALLTHKRVHRGTLRAKVDTYVLGPARIAPGFASFKEFDFWKLREDINGLVFFFFC
jgi:hypothetical protein